jgi:hypothetical protein
MDERREIRNREGKRGEGPYFTTIKHRTTSLSKSNAAILTGPAAFCMVGDKETRPHNLHGK